MHRLQGSPRSNQFRGQPVEQLRMGRPSSVATEIAWGLDEADGEAPLPDSIGHQPRHQGVIWICEPIRQRPPPLSFGSILRNHDRSDRGRDRRQHEFQGLFRIAASQFVNRVRLAEYSGKGASSRALRKVWLVLTTISSSASWRTSRLETSSAPICPGSRTEAVTRNPMAASLPSESPAICSRTNSSNGRSRLKARIT